MILAPAGGAQYSGPLGAGALYNLKTQFVATLEEVRTIQERAARDIRERAAKEQELREDLQGTREKVDRLKSMLEGTARELRTEVQDLQSEHQELEVELRALVDVAQKGFQSESEDRTDAAAKLKRQATSLSEKQAADRKRREAVVDKVRQEVSAAVQAQIEQEANALAQSTEFIREVNVALQSEGSERARRDQAIEQSVQVTRSMVTEVNEKLQETSSALNQEVASRQKDNARQKAESESMWETIRLQQRRVEAQQLGWSAQLTGASAPKAGDGIGVSSLAARPVSVCTPPMMTDTDVRQVRAQGHPEVQSQFQSQGSIQSQVIGQPQAQRQARTQQQFGSMASSRNSVSQSPERRSLALQQGLVVLPRQVPVQWIGPSGGGSMISSMVPQKLSPRQMQSPVTSQVQLR